MKEKILFVEDDESLAFITRDNLEIKGYDVTHFMKGGQALNYIKNGQNYDLAILDVMLPDVDGFTLAAEIRKQSQDTPILFLTAKSMKEDRLKGFETGGDDYLAKPFSIEELIYKIGVFMKRKKVVHQSNQQSYKIGGYQFDFSNLSLSFEESVKRLTHREAEVLLMLIKQKSKVVTRESILEQIWGENDYFYGRSLDVFISKLRKYLKKDPNIEIINIHGIGFKIIENAV